MAHTHTFLIPKQSDKQILDGLRRALNASGVPWIEIKANHPLLQAHYVFPREGDGDPTGQRVLALGAQVISSFGCAFEHIYSGYNIRVNREGTAAHDTVQFTSGDQHPERDSQDPVKLSQLQALLEKELKAFRLQDSIGRLFSKDLQQHYEEREASLSHLEGLCTNLIEDIARRQQKESETLQSTFSAKEAALLQSVTQLRQDAEDSAKKRSADLDSREEALAQKLKEIDDRDSRHARREIRKDMQKAIQGRAQKFELTRGTRHMRIPMHILCCCLLCGFGWGMWHTIQFGISGAEPWQVAVKQVLLGLGLSSTAVFYIRWLNDWFQQHSVEEFKLKRLELDLERASWVVEMALEWKDEKGTDFPEELVKTLARNLFVDGDTKNVSMHPADQLASALLGASAEATVALPGGSSVKLDRKGIGQLKKEKE